MMQGGVQLSGCRAYRVFGVGGNKFTRLGFNV